MTADIPSAAGRLADNILHFCRLLRAAGLPVGPGRALDAARAAALAGVRRRDDLYWTLHASLVARRDCKPVFDRAFDAFWGLPESADAQDATAAPLTADRVERAAAGQRRVDEAMRLRGPEEPPENRLVADATATASAREALRKRDFEPMRAAEFAEAQEAARALARRIAPMSTRRFRVDRRGARLDPRATMRASARRGGTPVPPLRRRCRVAAPPLVLLCDISGSMGRYSRVLLHFAHALAAGDGARVHAFVFGTRLTDITRRLRGRDPDAALDAVVGAVDDWSGGTRIGAALETFNRCWSRRVLGRGARVLLVSDGLDREAGAGLAAAADRLRRSCRRLVWLNPLLRYEAFEPKAAGVRALLPRVDLHLPAHDLHSLDALARSLGDRRGALL